MSTDERRGYNNQNVLLIDCLRKPKFVCFALLVQINVVRNFVFVCLSNTKSVDDVFGKLSLSAHPKRSIDCLGTLILCPRSGVSDYQLAVRAEPSLRNRC